MASMQSAAFFCLSEHALPMDNRHIYTGLCLGSATLGLIGASIQIHQWRPLLKMCRYRRKPSPNPMIVLCLAFADLFACFGVMLRAGAMLSTSPPAVVNATHWSHCNATSGSLGEQCKLVPLDGNTPLLIAGTTIEILNQYLYGATFLWTVTYAADIYLQLADKEPIAGLYHACSWLVPAVTTAGSFLVLFLGPVNLFDACPQGFQLSMKYLFSYSPIIIAVVLIPVLYGFSSSLISKRMRESGLLNGHNRAIMSALKRKFLSVIIIFVICWLPNLVDMAIQLYGLATEIPGTSYAQFFPLWAMEAVFNPLQGLLNFCVYGRHRLINRLGTTGNHAVGIIEYEVTEYTPVLTNPAITYGSRGQFQHFNSTRQ